MKRQDTVIFVKHSHNGEKTIDRVLIDFLLRLWYNHKEEFFVWLR